MFAELPEGIKALIFILLLLALIGLLPDFDGFDEEDRD